MKTRFIMLNGFIDCCFFFYKINYENIELGHCTYLFFFTSFLLAEDKPNVLFIAIESQGCFNGSLNFLSNQ